MAVTFANCRRAVSPLACASLFDVIDTAHTGVDSAGEGQESGPGKVERGVGGVPGRRECIEPALQDRVLAALELRVRIAVEEADPEFKVVSGDRMRKASSGRSWARYQRAARRWSSRT